MSIQICFFTSQSKIALTPTCQFEYAFLQEKLTIKRVVVIVSSQLVIVIWRKFPLWLNLFRQKTVKWLNLKLLCYITVLRDELSNQTFSPDILHINNTSLYIRCAHSGTSTLLLCACLRRCATLHHHHKKKKLPVPGIEPARRAYLHTEPPSVLKSNALSTRPRRQLCMLFKTSPFLLAENALLCAAWDNGVSQSVSQWQSNFSC